METQSTNTSGKKCMAIMSTVDSRGGHCDMEEISWLLVTFNYTGWGYMEILIMDCYKSPWVV